MAKDRTLADTEIQIAIAQLAYASENAAEHLLQTESENIYTQAIYSKLEALELILRKHNKMDVLQGLL
jgi:hypothetical protein